MARLNVFGKMRLAGELFWHYARLRLLLRARGLTPTLRALRRPLEERPIPDVGSLDTRLTSMRLANAVSRTLPLLPTENRCLMQSLVLLGALARRRIPVTLVIAVAPGSEAADGFAAHAWVELGDRPLLPTHGDDFARLAEL